MELMLCYNIVTGWHAGGNMVFAVKVSTLQITDVADLDRIKITASALLEITSSPEGNK